MCAQTPSLRPQRFVLRPATLYVGTTITLTAPTAHRIHSSAIIPTCPPMVRVFQVFKKYLRLLMCAQTPSALTAPPPSALRPPPCPQRFARHSTSSPTAFILCHCPHLVALGSGFQVFKKYLEASNVCLHSSAIVPTWPPLVPVSPIVPTWPPLVRV